MKLVHKTLLWFKINQNLKEAFREHANKEEAGERVNEYEKK
jgi:hypothetical protein